MFSFKGETTVASAPVRKLSKDRATPARSRTRVASASTGTPERPRLCVYRSLGHIYAQVIDDRSGHTLVSASSVDKETKKGLKGGGNIAAAKAVGKIIADRAKAAGVVKSGVRPRRLQVSRPRQGARRRGAGSGVTVLSLCRSKFCETVWQYGGSWR